MEKRVGDIMVPIMGFATVPADCTVKEAVTALARARQGCQVVLVMEDDKVAGMVGLKEVMRALDPVMFKRATYGGWTINPDWKEPVVIAGDFHERCAALAERAVKEIMAPLPRQLKAQDTIIKAAHIIAGSGQEALPVWQEDRLVGMVGIKEIFTEMIRELEGAGNGPKSKVIFADQFRRKARVTTTTG